MEISLTTLSELLFASEDTTLDGQREWAARNILDYHSSECRVVSAELAASIKEADPEANVFYVMVTGENNKTFILWRKSAWLLSRHRRMNLKVTLAVERHQRDVINARSEAERLHIKACQEWLARFASRFCDISPGYKVSFLRDALFKLAGKVKYDLDSLYPLLIDILEEETVNQLWVAPPIKTYEQDEHRQGEEVSTAPSQAGETVGEGSATGAGTVGCGGQEQESVDGVREQARPEVGAAAPESRTAQESGN